METVFRAMGAVLMLVALFAGGCASLPAGPATVPLATPCDDCLRGVTNFAKVSPALWRGSQPTAEGFRNLEKAGVRTVVNVRVGFYVAAYRIVVDRWNSDDAIREMVPFHYSPLWFRIPHVLRGIDVEKLQARIAAP